MAKVNKSDPLGYGCSLFRDVSRNMKSSSGIARIYESIYGRLTDSLWYSDSYGIPLRKILRNANPVTYPSIAGRIEQELLKDTRIAAVSVQIVYNEATKVVTVYINGKASNGQSFGLVGSADSLSQSAINFNIT